MGRTLRIQNLDDATTRRLQNEATLRGLSVEVFVARLLKEGTKRKAKAVPREIHHDLDKLAGSWSKREAASFLKRVQDFSKVDEKLWR